MTGFLAVDKTLKSVLCRADLIEDQLSLEEIIYGFLIIMALHIKRRVHLRLVALDLNQSQIVNSAICLFKELVG